jgi:hypothetical protein
MGATGGSSSPTSSTLPGAGGASATQSATAVGQGGSVTAQGGVNSTASTGGGSSATGGSKATGGSSATGGSKAAGGSSATGGTKATGGSSATGGTKATGGTTSVSSCTKWPAATSTVNISSTQTVTAATPFDGGLKQYEGWGGGQAEDQEPLFVLKDGATLRNVIIGLKAGDGIHCEGSCTLENVWWIDVGEDAATLKGSQSSQVMTINCAGAKGAADKIFQHNGPGTMIIKNFWTDDFGKVYRSCGNCSTQYQRNVVFSSITATNGSAIAGINSNYKDTAKFWNVSAGGATLCQKYIGNNSGDEPTKDSATMDGTYCINLTAAP